MEVLVVVGGGNATTWEDPQWRLMAGRGPTRGVGIEVAHRCPAVARAECGGIGGHAQWGAGGPSVRHLQGRGAALGGGGQGRFFAIGERGTGD